MKKLMLVSALAMAAAIATNADAQTFDFTVGGPVTGSGTFTTSDNGDGSFTITDITGTFDSMMITGLLPPGSLGDNDNLLLPNSDPQLTFNGFSFTTAANNYNIFYNDGLGTYRLITNADGADNLSITFSAIAADAGVPEPATWGLMILGFGTVGAAMRRRSTKVAYAA